MKNLVITFILFFNITISCYSQIIQVWQNGHKTIFANADSVIYLRPEDVPQEYVDLALPSGTMWATTNLNASAPEETGGYYAWGETHQKFNFTGESYTNPATFNDAATEQLGPDWSVPTSDQMKELRDYCMWQEESIGAVKGCRVTGSNGNSIFLPYAGFMSGRNVEFSNRGYIMSNEEQTVYNVGTFPLILQYIRSSVSYNYRFESEAQYWYYSHCEGYQIRPVKKNR